MAFGPSLQLLGSLKGLLRMHIAPQVAVSTLRSAGRDNYEAALIRLLVHLNPQQGAHQPQACG